MIIRGTTLIGRLAAIFTLLLAFTACGGGGGDSGFLPPDVPDVTTDLAITTTALPNAVDGIAYTALVEADGGTKPYAWSVIDNGGTELAINNQGILSGTAPSIGDYGVSLRVTDSTNTQVTSSFILTVTGETPVPLAIATPSPLTGAEQGKPYTAILEAVGGQGGYMWTLIDNSDSGLRLGPDGILSGTAPAEGQYVIKVSVMDDSSTVSEPLIVNVTAFSSPLTITTSTLRDGETGVPYAEVLSASGGDKRDYKWTLLSNGGLSTLTVSIDGVLNGVPNKAGTFGLVYQVSDGNNTDQLAATLTIASEPDIPPFPPSTLTITTAMLRDAVQNMPYAEAMAAEGGTPPYNWFGVGSDNFTGFTMSPVGGIISGTTSVPAGPYGYSVTLTDSTGASVVRSYIINVL